VAIRTNSAAVQALLDAGKNYDGTTSLIPFMETASAIVDDVALCAIARNKTLDADRLELIERWLAAHCYKLADQGYASNSTADASASYQGQTGMYLEGTKYGQMAVRLDKSGCLQAIAGNERKAASGFWLGKTAAEQLTWEERNL
jgi:hypothetical protein